MKKQISTTFAIIFLVGIAIIVAYFVFSYFDIVKITFPTFPSFPRISFPFLSEVKDVEKFTSEENFKAYLEEAELEYYGMPLGGAMARGVPEMGVLEEEAVGGGAPERVSTTTVQVLGIDEPDIVKTDGKEIYFSPGYAGVFVEETMIMPPAPVKTKVIKAFPPVDLSLETEITENGSLLLKENILVIFAGDKIYGYDVQNPASPKKKWTVEIEDGSYVSGARLYNGKIYLITATSVDTYHPCPIRPLSVEGVSLEVRCTDIYHPITPVPVDVTFTAMILEPDSGQIEKNISFVGSSFSSIVYMSEQNLYISYSYYGDFIKFLYNFFKDECRDIVPTWVIEKIGKLIEYDISQTAKLTESGIIWQKYVSSLDRDERLRVENEMMNRMESYYQEHNRDLEKTGIVKIGLEEFEVSATGEVPGFPLNQFSLDEYNDYLRLATTVGGGFGLGIGESANDVYVLDKNLRIKGSIKDLGLEERIYSARFIEDKGYLVTFKVIDPFFVLDLSNPGKPELRGELKIPGYSSYLYPITKDKILGIGMEDWQVKISLFDVSSPDNPTELAKYTLDEYWSDVLETHHAFLLDKEHEIFFLPGGKGGYVLSYKDYKLEMIRAVSDIRARRAIYIDDYLYIIGDDEIVILNEIDWEKVNNLEF